MIKTNIASSRSAAVAAALVLVIGMGFGRFAFTGLYPSMVSEDALSLNGGSYAASANYAGYLFGALLLGFLSGCPAGHYASSQRSGALPCLRCWA